MAEPLLEVRGLKTRFSVEEGSVLAVDDVSFSLPPGGTLGVVGESGCGKSVTALSVMRLVPDPPGRVVAGEIRFKGRDLLALPEQEMRRIRGNQISMIFQEPMTSLNPVYTVGEQIGEPARVHQGLDRKQAKARAVEMLHQVGIPAPEQRVDSYPHQLSGGMRQRVMIAMALACNPELVIADEPTTALDVTIQAQILELMRGLQKRLGMAVMFITHNLGVIAQIADTVAIMYLGQVVEYGPVREILRNPKHPYTIDLLRAVPRLGKTAGQWLVAIEGSIPSPFQRPTGCPFHPRCSRAMAGRCEVQMPALTHLDEQHSVRCLLYEPETSNA